MTDLDGPLIPASSAIYTRLIHLREIDRRAMAPLML